MGSNPDKDKNARENEQPQHRLYLPDYYIARTPVTNAEYRYFIEAGAIPRDGVVAGQPRVGHGKKRKTGRNLASGRPINSAK